MPTITLRPSTASPVPYPILIEEGSIAQLSSLLDGLRPDLIAILHDEGVTPIAQQIRKLLPRSLLLSVPSGEGSKSLATIERLAAAMLKKGLTRRSVLINVGGGMLTDLGGFLASIYMRGIRYINIPTTMLGMVDAGVGGKTGIDLGSVKNILGTIAHPSAIVIDPQFLATLPEPALAEGLVEAVKMAAILDEKTFAWYEAHLPDVLKRDPHALQEAIMTAVQLKADTVMQDERDDGKRLFLNFGHTIGHAVEAWSEFTIPHGQAVSIGMVAEMALAKTNGADRITRLLEAMNMPTTMPADAPSNILWKLMQSDKKNAAGQVRMAVPVSIGKGEMHPIREEDFRRLCP
jgi:3-dehydroquinate synthase